MEALEDRTLLAAATLSGAESATDGAPYTLDLSTLDAGTISQWTVDWGDGSPVQNVPGNPSSVQHTFNDSGSTHVIRAAATDEHGTFDALFADGDLVIPGYTSHNALRYDRDTGELIDVFVPSRSGGLRNPVGATFGPDGNYYVASFATDDVLRYDGRSGAFIDEFVPAALGGLDGSLDVVFGPDGNLYVSSVVTNNVLRYDGTTGAFIDIFASGVGLNDPRGLIFGPDGNLYVSSEFTDSVERFDGNTGAALGSFVSSSSGGLDFPEGLLFGPDGNLYVASRITDSVLRYDGATGAFLDEFVLSGSGGLNGPIDMVFGPDGNLYVSSLGSNEVLRYDGLTGGFIDTFIDTASDGLTLPVFLNYEPLAVTVEPSSFVVTNTNDSGPGSLRQAILDANASPLAQTIVFNIPTTDANFVDVDSTLVGGDAAPDAFLIRPLSALPALSDVTGGSTIDGRTQTAFSGDTNPFGPEIVIDGSSVAGDGLQIVSDNNAVLGLNVQQFSGSGIRVIGGNSNWIAGNYVGTDATGTLDRGNGAFGVDVRGGAQFNVIGTNGDGIDDGLEGNVISGNASRGIEMPDVGTNHNVIAGNFIGTDATGTAALGNDSSGIAIGFGAQFNRVGTNGDSVSDEFERNIISGNLAIGVSIVGAGTDRNIVAGNYIGTDVTGTAALGNGSGVGIRAGAANNLIGTNGDGVGDDAERNLIAASGGRGVEINGVGSDYNVVAGNFIGTDVTGTVALGNRGFTAVRITSGAQFNVIGTDGSNDAFNANERNLISGNNAAAVTIDAVGSDQNVVAGNFVGTDVTGTLPLGNGGIAVIRIADGAGNRIGTNGDGVADEAEGNTIAFNTLSGVAVTGATTTGNSIRGNSIHSNGGLGIDLANDGVTASDLSDADTGPNNLQNFPVLLGAVSGASTRLVGVLNSTANMSFTIEFFANTAADPSGYGEGQRLLGSSTATTDASGNASFDVTFAATTTSSEFITATATDAGGNTSEFSAALQADTPANTFFVTNTNNSGAGSLRQAIIDANAHPGADAITFNIPATDAGFVDVDSSLSGGDAAPDAFVIRPLSALPALKDATGGTTIDGRTQTIFGGDTNPFGPEIILDGSMFDPSIGDQDGLKINSDGNHVFDLNFQSFTGDGIQISGNDNWLAGNFIGTDATGLLAMGNGRGDSGTRAGVLILSGAQSNIIGTNGDGLNDAAERNVISGNHFNGIQISGSSNVVAGNFIGTDATGTAALANGTPGVVSSSGILVAGGSNRIGTNGDGVADAAERNVISANLFDGLNINGAAATYNVVAGNFIGTDVTGTAGLGNASRGVQLVGGAQFNRIGTNGDGLADDAERNVLSDNLTGVLFNGDASDNVIAGNYIGTDVTGTVALGNSFQGIWVASFSGGMRRNNRIGTNGDGIADAAERNVISGNGFNGVRINGATVGTVVAGNYIGTDESGLNPLGNAAAGVGIHFDTLSNRIGTDSDGVQDDAEANLIAFNGGPGVMVQGGIGHTFRGNSIHTNGGLGIDLNGDGVTASDPSDADTGPNNLQNFPVLLGAVPGASTRLVGVLNSTANMSFTIEFFANTTADPSGYGQGERLLGSTSATTDGSGNASFDVTFAAATISSEFMTATATDADGNTSEFSAALQADTPAGTFFVTNTNNSGAGSLRQAITDANTAPGDSEIVFNISTTDANFLDVDASLPGGDAEPDVFVIQPLSALPALSNANGGITIDGHTQTTFGGDTNPKGPEVAIAGSSAGPDTHGLSIFSSNNRVFALNIQQFTLHGIRVAGGDANWIAGNFIGVDATGTLPRGNGGNGVQLDIRDSEPNVFTRFNVIGTNGDGLDDDSEGNVIAYNTADGVLIAEFGTDSNRVAGNRIENNDRMGVQIVNGARFNRVGSDGDGTSDDRERNVISGNQLDGVRLSHGTSPSATNTNGNLVTGNDVSNNGRFGVFIGFGASFSQIGTGKDALLVNPALSNTIAGNAEAGVMVWPVGNPTNGNLSNANTIRGNSIYGNGGLGIDLGVTADGNLHQGVTANDGKDVDNGANRLQNFPVLQYGRVGTVTQVIGKLNSAPSTEFTLDFYANNQRDPTGYGEGKLYLGSTKVTTNSAGNVNFNVTLPVVTNASQFITATATDPSGNTSEFALDLKLDSSRPTSRVDLLPRRATNLTFPVSVTGDDPLTAGQVTSGVATYDVFVSVDGAPFALWTTLSATSPVASFTGESSHTYAFQSFARDLAGNVESKPKAVEASTYVPDLDGPVTQVDSVDATTATFTVNFSGSDSGGSKLAFIDLFVSVDGGPAQNVATVNTGGVASYSGAVSYQAIADGSSHSYRFYTVGIDGNANIEAAPAVPADVLVTATFAAPRALQVVSFDVQKGALQRSYVRYLDITFNTATGLQDIVDSLSDADSSNDRIKLTQFDLNGGNGTARTLNAAMITIVGQTIQIDFGPAGIGGNRNSNAGDGYYGLAFDLDDNLTPDSELNFYRLFGDTNGDRKVDSLDLTNISAAFGQSGPSLDADINGDGLINILDRMSTFRALGHSIDRDLPLDD